MVRLGLLPPRGTGRNGMAPTPTAMGIPRFLCPEWTVGGYGKKSPLTNPRGFANVQLRKPGGGVTKPDRLFGPENCRPDGPVGGLPLWDVFARANTDTAHSPTLPGGLSETIRRRLHAGTPSDTNGSPNGSCLPRAACRPDRHHSDPYRCRAVCKTRERSGKRITPRERFPNGQRLSCRPFARSAAHQVFSLLSRARPLPLALPGFTSFQDPRQQQTCQA